MRKSINLTLMISLKATFLVAFCLSSLLHAKDVDEQFEIGKQKAKVCMTCHGVDGIATQNVYPNLRGQNKSYLISSLKDYKTRERTSGLAVLMQQQADVLSNQDIEDISHFYSKLGSQTQP
ncbi:c-type cytochrome [Vibrio sagamiensis]|uniref:Cytochrome c biogenesis protein CcsB n=1 Tax=Vibrio sagamiensis NBRC 104589 TaxID=1219064 RepID=A0A511QCS1_9VIBR|nr:cytochrome c biogenesis protein CcsB [Vibrio sagamiensis NBRC 104589]